MRRRPRGTSTPQSAVIRQAASLLLQYPDDTLLGRLPLLESAVAGLPDEPRVLLARFLRHLADTPQEQLAVDYVETFDLKRRCCPYLTYYAYGDTRKRGMALLRFTAAYRAAGVQLADDELPDHLAVVLEFAVHEFTATGDAREGERLLREYRPGLELLRLALEEAQSPYADVVRAVITTLPAIEVRDREAVLRLAREGPPEEEVGLAPFGMPEPSGART